GRFRLLQRAGGVPDRRRQDHGGRHGDEDAQVQGAALTIRRGDGRRRVRDAVRVGPLSRRLRIRKRAARLPAGPEGRDGRREGEGRQALRGKRDVLPEARRPDERDCRRRQRQGDDRRRRLARAAHYAGGVTELESGSPEETEGIAARLAVRLVPGDVVLVEGELGSGKTTFVRGAARALGVEGPVTSPTYTIGHRYRGRVDVSHLDLYRFEGMSNAEWGDLEEYFEDAVVFVEW